MKTFHAGGRIGDIVFALYTMRALGGGKLYVSDYHTPNWSLDIARTMESFLLYQDYVEEVEFVHHADLPKVDYDLQQAEDDYNPEAFPEWDGKPWPSNCGIKKRYAVHFGVKLEEGPWLTAPVSKNFAPIAFQAPKYRILRSVEDWLTILAYLDNRGAPAVFLGPKTTPALLGAATAINSARVFLGAISSCNAIAEGLGKRRIIEVADDCWNVDTAHATVINGCGNRQVVDTVLEAIR